MDSHWQLTDLAFDQQITQGSLPAALFTHEAHLRLAWIYLHRYSLEDALSMICLRLTSYIAGLGASDKFNKTLTLAAMKAVHHFMQKAQSTTFAGLVVEFPRLRDDFKALLSSHYSRNRLWSEQAKHEFLEPDLLPF